jgi:hypothetical protein
MCTHKRPCCPADKLLANRTEYKAASNNSNNNNNNNGDNNKELVESTQAASQLPFVPFHSTRLTSMTVN